MFTTPRARLAPAALAACVLAPVAAFAHGSAETMMIASSADGGGRLTLEFDFSTIARTSYSATIGSDDVYTGVLPAFEEIAADDAVESLYTLDPGTGLEVELTGLPAGVAAVKIGAALLSAVGDTAVLGTAPLAHTHPEWQLVLASGAVGEGDVSLRIKATPPSAYTDSEIYTVHLATGVAPPFAYDTAVYDATAVACQAALSKADARIAAGVLRTWQKCMTGAAALAANEALASPPANLADLHEAAEATCVGLAGSADAKTPLGRVDAIRAAAARAITARCSASMDERAVADHVADQVCRSERLLGSTYPAAKALLGEFVTQPSQGADALASHLPCLTATIGE